jgi:hypothetical protein
LIFHFAIARKLYRSKPTKETKTQTPTPVAPIVDDHQFYRDKDLAKLFHIHPVTVWAWVRQGILSPPTKLALNTSRFLGRTVNQDIAKKLAGEIFVA